MPQPYFEPLNIGEEVFDFSHLEPFTLDIDSKMAKKWLRVHVTFSNHCFTKRYKAEEHINGEPIFDELSPRPRLFCRVRYRLSKALPGLIRSLNNPKAKVWETTARRNWEHSISIDNPAGPYHVFLEIRRTPVERKHLQDINLIVESAYHESPEDGPPDLLGSMAFILLCGKVFTKQPTSTKR